MCLKKEIQRRFGFTQPVNSVYVGILNSSGIDFVDIDNYVESMYVYFLFDPKSLKNKGWSQWGWGVGMRVG